MELNQLKRPAWFDGAMARLLTGRSLEPAVMAEALRDVKSGRLDDALATAFLISLRCKGESGEELAAAATVLREEMNTIDPRGRAVVDTCGTGGDDAGTFNISTAAALVACAAGLNVVKHGNRAVSGKTGSADLLTGLGLPIENGLSWAQECLDRHGFAFCYAPHVHPGLAAVSPLRRKLGLRTIFNLLGPLANPARAPFQLLGVGKPELLAPLADAVSKLGLTRAVLVHGCDGLDEITLSGPTTVRIVSEGRVRTEEWTPELFGLPRATVESIRATSPSESVSIVRRVFDGEDGSAKHFVLANAAAAMWVSGAVPDLRNGVARAEDAIRSGAVNELIQKLAGKDSHAA